MAKQVETRQRERCAALDINGRQCRNRAIAYERYHGSDEFYGFFSQREGVSWVRVAFCQKHKKKS